MKIVVNYLDGEIFQHFGQTPEFKVYEVEDSKVVDSYVISADPEGHRALGKQLVTLKADVVICGSLGIPMLEILQGAGIEVCGNVSGNADEAVQAYLNGTLKSSTEAHSCGCGH